MLLADRPHLFPGHTLTGETTGPVVDTGIELPVGGRVYLARHEVASAANLLGYATPAQVDALKAEAHAADLRAQQAEQRMSQMRRVFEDETDEVAVP